MSLIDSFLKLSVGMAEVGLLATESAMRTAQTTIERLAGIERDAGIIAPLNGPPDLDHAVSEAANRTVSILRLTPREWPAVAGAFQDLQRIVTSSFRFVDWTDPKSLLLPLQL